MVTKNAQIRAATVGGAKIMNAQQFADQLDNRPNWIGQINELHIGLGPQPSRGRFLVSRADYDAQLANAGNVAIVLARDLDGTLTTVTINNYVITYNQEAMKAKNESPMIVEVADVRYLLQQVIINQAFNVDDDTLTWQNVLDTIKALVPSNYAQGLNFVNVPDPVSYKPSNLRYENWTIADALNDVAIRTGHVLALEPSSGQVYFDEITGSQASDVATIAAADLNRNLQTQAHNNANQVGEVVVAFDRDSNEIAHQVTKDNTANTSTNQVPAWGSRVYDGTNDTEVGVEADALAATWFGWSARLEGRSIREFFGVLGVKPGGLIGMITYRIDGPEIYTIIDQGPGPRPITKRQPSRSVNLPVWMGRAASVIDPAATNTGDVILYDPTVSPPVPFAPEQRLNAVLDVMHSGEQISTSKFVAGLTFGMIERFMWAECEDDPEPGVKLGASGNPDDRPDPESTTFGVWVDPTRVSVMNRTGDRWLEDGETESDAILENVTTAATMSNYSTTSGNLRPAFVVPTGVTEITSIEIELGSHTGTATPSAGQLVNTSQMNQTSVSDTPTPATIDNTGATFSQGSGTVVTYTWSTPVSVNAGDVLYLDTPASGTVSCLNTTGNDYEGLGQYNTGTPAYDETTDTVMRVFGS